MVKKIILYNNKGIALVDDEDYERLKEYKWHLSINKYANTNIKIENKKTIKHMHQLIIKTPKNMDIDHINRNKLDNRKSNLRIVTRSQNNMNSKSAKNSSSIYKGVCWDKSRNKWIVHIMLNYKSYYIGRFNNEKDAANAYNKRAHELFGEYANLNVVD